MFCVNQKLQGVDFYVCLLQDCDATLLPCLSLTHSEKVSYLAHSALYIANDLFFDAGFVILPACHSPLFIKPTKWSYFLNNITSG